MVDGCIFCGIADLRVPAELLYQDHLLVAFRDIKPAAPVHILIVPKKHIADVRDLGDIDAEMLGKVFAVAALLAKQEGIADSGFRLVVNTGPDAGQTVEHIHFHLLGGREMGWPPE
ncbi:MAG TPA: histidine triad nucleotide-binding protein [Armatimonadota bacterium]|nr:histidine triad nucleotide-binding protein [Armatimonadota bacterium]HOS43509.1 histidine triad nucleotide-binding protein [Armatimonadota bacterium]